MAKIKDYKRVVGIADLLDYAGRTLSRKGVRYTTIAVGITGGIFAGQFLAHSLAGLMVRFFGIESERITSWVAVLSKFHPKMLWIPVVIAILTFGLGYACRFLSNLCSLRKRDIAYGSSLDLVEDCVKERTDEHIDMLWERVNKYDSALKNTDEDRRRETTTDEDGQR